MKFLLLQRFIKIFISLKNTFFQRNERRPKRNSSEFKSKKKLALGDNDEDDDENSDSDNEQNVEDENFEVTTLETSTTRSGRQVKQRVIQGKYLSHRI